MGLEKLNDFCRRFKNARWYINVLTYPLQLDIALLDSDTKKKIISDAEQLNLPNKEFIINHLQNS